MHLYRISLGALVAWSTLLPPVLMPRRTDDGEFRRFARWYADRHQLGPIRGIAVGIRPCRCDACGNRLGFSHFTNSIRRKPSSGRWPLVAMNSTTDDTARCIARMRPPATQDHCRATAGKGTGADGDTSQAYGTRQFVAQKTALIEGPSTC